ncbi:MAG: hypothetical protein K2W92_01090 [Alphaproteobacteria bacterium]|nr:hypothetical protein [Alphaproteobacteria bacterium]
MNIKTLTSAIVLTFLMTSPAVMALEEDPDPKDTSTPVHVSLQSPARPDAEQPAFSILSPSTWKWWPWGGSTETPIDQQPPNSSSPLVASSIEVDELPLNKLMPIRLRKASINVAEGTVVTEESGIITVRTDNKGLHKYQLESEKIPVKPGDRLKISYNITSSEDGIVLGLLKTNRAGWLPDSRVDLKGGPQQGTIEVLVPEGESLPHFVVYNNQTNTPSTEVTINSLTIEKEEK